MLSLWPLSWSPAGLASLFLESVGWSPPLQVKALREAYSPVGFSAQGYPAGKVAPFSLLPGTQLLLASFVSRFYVSLVKQGVVCPFQHPPLGKPFPNLQFHWVLLSQMIMASRLLRVHISVGNCKSIACCNEVITACPPHDSCCCCAPNSYPGGQHIVGT